MKWVVAFSAAALALTVGGVHAFQCYCHGVSVVDNCGGYTITVNPSSPNGWEFQSFSVSPGAGSYEQGSSTMVEVEVYAVWVKVSGPTPPPYGTTHTLGDTGYLYAYGYKPPNCSPEQEAQGPPVPGAAQCIRHVRITTEPGSDILWDGHTIFTAGSDGIAFVEYAPAGTHHLSAPGLDKQFKLDSDFCGVYEVALDAAPEPSAEPPPANGIPSPLPSGSTVTPPPAHPLWVLIITLDPYHPFVLRHLPLT